MSDKGFSEIVEMVAEYVEMFDAKVLHDYRLSDCIRAKFNIRPGKKWMRKNPNGWRSPVQRTLGRATIPPIRARVPGDTQKGASWDATSVSPLGDPQDTPERGKS